MYTSTLATSSSSHSLSSVAGCSTIKLAARRWRNIAYGRLKRAPKLPAKPQSSSSSSSSSEDEDEDDDSSSSSAGDDEEEAGAEYEMDTKDLCIEIKVAKDTGGAGERGR